MLICVVNAFVPATYIFLLYAAYFEDNEPIYSARYVRFSLGYPKLPLGPEDLMLDDNDGNLVSDNNYIWTYTSPMFSMMQVIVMYLSFIVFICLIHSNRSSWSIIKC